MRSFQQGLTAVSLIVLCELLLPQASATVLTFNVNVNNGTPPGVAPAASSSLETTYAGYGDNVNSTTQVAGATYYNYALGNGFTPNITVGYSKGTSAERFDIYREPPGWGSQQIAYPVRLSAGSFTDDKYYFTFTPSNSYGVVVNSFELIDFNGTQTYTGNWTVYKDSVLPANVLATGATGSFNNAFANPLIISPNAQPHYGVVILEFHRTSGARGNLGIDNLNFDQVPPVPEPSTLALLGLGAIGLAVKRRRCRSNRRSA